MLRSLFTWSVAGIVVPALLGAGGAVIGVTLESQLGPWLVGAAGLWMSITILLDHGIRRKLVGVVLSSITTLLAIAWIESVITDKQLKETEGSLIAANLPMPLSDCPVPQDALAIYIGSNVAWATSFPHTVFRSNGYDLLVLDRDLAGGIVVTAKIFDDRQNLVAEIVKNHFLASNYASHFGRPDRSSLIVYDHLDVPALEIQFLNDRAISIPLAQIRAPGGRALRVTTDSVFIGRSILSHVCAGNGGSFINF